MAIRGADSADRHGVPPEDALHAIGNAYYVETGVRRAARPPNTVRPTLYIGPPRQVGGALLEVMVEVVLPRDLVIFHVMPARQKHLERMNGEL